VGKRCSVSGPRAVACRNATYIFCGVGHVQDAQGHDLLRAMRAADADKAVHGKRRANGKDRRQWIAQQPGMSQFWTILSHVQAASAPVPGA